jgi:hypothetical protein
VVEKYNASEFAGIVNKDDPETYLVATPQLVPPMINAIKELAAAVELLQAEIADLRARLDAANL